jgi:iron complex outermembrane recepter protein
MSKQFLLLTCALGALTGLAGAASAADTPPPAATATEVGAVIITAEKREANLQKVPVAVTAFTRTQRDRTGIETLQDFTNYTPGLDYDAVDDHLFIRGVGRESINLGASSGVAAYIDGFYQPEPINAIDPPMFSQSVDVLRGPQGTLSGRNGIGGALFVTSSRPTSKPYAEARFTIGNYGLFDYEGAVSGPIVDGLNFRLSAYGRTQNDGYFKNVADGVTAGGVTNEYHVEGSVTAKLGDNADLFVRAFSSDADNFAGPTVRASFSPSSITSPGATVLNQNGGSFFNSGFGFNPQAVNPTFINPNIRTNPSTSNPYNYLSSQDYHNHVDNDANINYIFTYHFPSVDLKYTGGYAQYDYTGDLPGQANTDVLSYQVPLTASALGAGFDNPTCVAKTSSNAVLQAVENCLTVHPGGLTETFQQKDAWWSQEAVLTSTTPGPLQWVAGVYYYHEQFANPQNERDPQQSQLLAPCDLTAANVPGAGTGGAAANAACSALGLFPFTSAPANPNGYLATSNYNLTDKSEAVFGQIDYKLNSAFKLTAGLRYTSDQKSGEEFVRAINFDNFQGDFNPLSIGSLVPAVDETNFACNQTLTASNPNFNPAFNKPDTNQKGVVSACTINPVTGVASRRLGGNSSAVTGTAGVEWTPDSSTLAYIRYSRGYKDLALNMGNLATVAEVAPETMNDYELGWKKSFGHNLVIDAALFYEDYFNFQDNLSTFQPATNTFTSEFTNVARARSAGFELETIWTPIDNLLVHFSYSYDNSGFADKCNLPGTAPLLPGQTPKNCFTDTAAPTSTPARVSASGELPNTPANRVSLTPQYTWVFDQGKLTMSGTYIWRDQQYGSIFNEPYYIAPSWSQVNLRLSWVAPGDRYEVILFGNNIFNTIDYATGASASAIGNVGVGVPLTTVKSYQIEAPTTFGLELHYKFF